LNRVNQYTPYGNLIYSQNRNPVFDEGGYNKALADWNARSESKGTPIYSTSYGGEGGGTAEETTIVGYTGGGDPGDMPTREQFTDPGSDEWSARVELSPEQQALLDKDTAIKTRLQDIAGQGLDRVNSGMNSPFDMSQLSAYQDVPQGGGAKDLAGSLGAYRTSAGSNIPIPGVNDFSADRTKVEDAIYSRLNPQLDRDRARLDQTLANQGIMQGSEAYKNAIDENDRAATDARMQAILAGGQEQSRLFNQGLAANNQDFNQNLTNVNLANQARSAQYGEGMQANQQDFAQQIAAANLTNQQRQQQLQEQAYLRSLPLNELNALRTGAQVQNPSFSSVPQTNVANTDVSGNIWNAYNANVGNANAETAANNSTMQGAASIAMLAAMF
jgi:hypothetical protein